MPILTITKLTFATVKFVKVTKSANAAVKAGTKLKVSPSSLWTAADTLQTIMFAIQDTVTLLGIIRGNLDNEWTGEDHDIYSAQHQKVIEECEQIEQCIRECSNFLRKSGNEFQNTLSEAKRSGGALVSPRGN